MIVSDIAILLVSCFGLLGIFYFIYKISDEKKGHQAQIDQAVEAVMPNHEELQNEPQAILGDIAQNIIVEREFLPVDAGNRLDEDKPMTKKMLKKAEKKRLKVQRRLDFQAWIEAKEERNRMKLERHLDRFGSQDNDDSGEESDNDDTSEQSTKEIIIDYTHYVNIFPQILLYMQERTWIDIQEMTQFFEISNTSIVMDIIKYFERSRSVHGIFLKNKRYYCRMDINDMKLIAMELQKKCRFDDDDIATVVSQHIQKVQSLK